jgi:hypothetical protein
MDMFHKIFPYPSLPVLDRKRITKEGYFPSLWQREVRRDFIKQSRYFYVSVNNFIICNDFYEMEVLR